MFCHFWQKFENSKWLPFLGRGIFFLRDRAMSTFAFFRTQNSQLVIYLINYSLTYEASPPKSNPTQAINPINLHAKFGKDRIRTVA